MLLDRNKDLKLVDFGLSTKYTDDKLLDQPCGTLYAAREFLNGNEYHGMLADVWNNGIVLFGMASGYLPFCDQDDEVNKKNVLEGTIDFP
jgi:serine/threonine protein kinase